MAIFRPKPSQIFFFGLVPKSPIRIGLIYVKNPKPNISCLGPFKGKNSSRNAVPVHSFCKAQRGAVGKQKHCEDTYLESALRKKFTPREDLQFTST
jgi:hypothetical protein